MPRHSTLLTSALVLIPALFAACSGPERGFGASETLASQDALNGSHEGNRASLHGKAAGSGAAAALATDAGAPASDPGDAASASPVLCGNAPCQCNNGIDDDGDGNIDGADVECTGALDDEELTFGTGIPGDNKDPKWQDCFFDGNSGHGDDRCRYPTGCLTGELSQDDPACAITQACLDECFPRTPSGCDCFGCCTVQLKGHDALDIQLSDTCSAGKLGDPDACPVCVKSTSCSNDDPPGSDEPTPAGDPEDPPAGSDPSDPPPPPDPEDPPAGTDPGDPPVIR
jgi:hypothetical protein